MFGDQNVSPFCLPDQDLDLIKVKKKKKSAFRSPKNVLKEAENRRENIDVCKTLSVAIERLVLQSHVVKASVPRGDF